LPHGQSLSTQPTVWARGGHPQSMRGLDPNLFSAPENKTQDLAGMMDETKYLHLLSKVHTKVQRMDEGKYRRVLRSGRPC
jgi:hypothetical protein